MVLRLLCGVGYIAIFLVYIGLHGAFPPDFTYWGMDSLHAGPVLYSFLWILGYVQQS